VKAVKNKLRITDTTDGKYIGSVINSDNNPITLSDGTMIYYDKVIQLPNGLRFANSSYIIDTIEIK
jgi:hypothetical protein